LLDSISERLYFGFGRTPPANVRYITDPRDLRDLMDRARADYASLFPAPGPTRRGWLDRLLRPRLVTDSGWLQSFFRLRWKAMADIPRRTVGAFRRRVRRATRLFRQAFPWLRLP